MILERGAKSGRNDVRLSNEISYRFFVSREAPVLALMKGSPEGLCISDSLCFECIPDLMYGPTVTGRIYLKHIKTADSILPMLCA